MYRIICVEVPGDDSPLGNVCKTLQKYGCQMEHLPVLAALEQIRQEKPDAILIDPLLAGEFQMSQELWQNPETEATPIIFVHPDDEQAGAFPVERFECGASDFIPASIEEQELLARLQTLIQSSNALREAAMLNRQLTEANRELQERNLQVEKELYTARQLQQSLLPAFLPDEGDSCDLQLSKCHYRSERLRISGLYIPCDALGGDIYDVIQFPNGTIGVTIADVSGHGVPAGFITAIFKSSFYRITHTHSRPGDILFHINNEMADIVKTGDYVTALYGLLQPVEGESEKLTFSFSGAGHPYPLYYNASERRLTQLKENGTPLVWFKNMEYATAEVQLSAGDKLLLFTDGVTELRNPQGELFGEEALERCFIELVESGESNMLDTLAQRLSDFTEGHPLEDDLSMVFIEI